MTSEVTRQPACAGAPFSKLVLHHCHDARSVRTLWLLHELGLEFDLIVHEFGRELQDPEYLKLSPVGRVPALVIDGQPMIETGAIAQYLCEVCDSDLIRRAGDPERAEFLQWLHFAETMAQHLAILTQQHIVIWEDKDRSPLLMKLERRRLEKILHMLDRHLAGDDRNHMLASGFSAADIAIGYGVEVARRFAPFDGLAHLMAYHDRLHARPALQRSLPPAGAKRIYTQPFYDVPEAS